MPVVFVKQSATYRAIHMADPESADILRSWIAELRPEAREPDAEILNELSSNGTWMLRSDAGDLIVVRPEDFVTDFDEVESPLAAFENMLIEANEESAEEDG